MKGMQTQRLVINKSGKLINNDGLKVCRPNVTRVIIVTAPIAKGKIISYNNSSYSKLSSSINNHTGSRIQPVHKDSLKDWD